VLQARPGLFDLAVLDMQMPAWTGYSADVK
jgi:CheY-like chemotaxis protein